MRALMYLLAICILMPFGTYLFAQNKNSKQCEKELIRIDKNITIANGYSPAARFDKLMALAEECPEYSPVFFQIQYETLNWFDTPNYFNLSIEYGNKAVSINPDNSWSHWYLANSWQMAGEFAIAVKHYRFFLENVDSIRFKEYCQIAKANIITCNYLKNNNESINYLSPEYGYQEALAKLDLSDNKVLERAGYYFIRELLLDVASIVVNNRITLSDRENVNIHYSLNWLDHFIKYPLGCRPVELNKYITSIISLISKIVHENNLNANLGLFNNRNNDKSINRDLPIGDFAPTLFDYTQFGHKDLNSYNLNDDPRIKEHIAMLNTTPKISSKISNSSPKWISDSLLYYQKAIKSSPNNIKNHWGYASLLEYIGEYGKAKQEYQWVIDNASDPKQKSNSRIHMITCQYLETKAIKKSEEEPKKPYQQPPDNGVKQETLLASVNGLEIDVTTQAIEERSGWTYLKGLASSIAVAGGVSVIGGDSKYVEYALNLLNNWIEAPVEHSIQARNEFLAGMISTLASIIAKYDLTLKLPSQYTPSKTGMPKGGFAGEFEEAFRKGNFDALAKDETKKVQLTDEVTFVENFEVENLSGEYECISPIGLTTGIHTGDHTITTYNPMVVSQNGKKLNLHTSMVIQAPAQNFSGNLNGYGYDQRSSGWTIIDESNGEGVLTSNEAIITWTITHNQSSSTISSTFGSSYTTPGIITNNRTTSKFIVLENGEIQISSTDLNGKVETSKFRKINR